MQTGILDKTRLVANILMVILVCLNIFFSTQYTENIRQRDAEQTAQVNKMQDRIQTAKVMKFFIDKVVATNGTITFEDRVKLEADVRSFNDPDLTKSWEAFTGSKDGEEAQKSVVSFMSMLANRMI